MNLLDKYNTNNQDFNQFINKYNIINIQKWMPSASINDVSNGIIRIKFNISTLKDFENGKAVVDANS